MIYGYPEHFIIEHLFLVRKDGTRWLMKISYISQGMSIDIAFQVIFEVKLVRIKLLDIIALILCFQFLDNLHDNFSRLINSSHIRKDQIDIIGQNISTFYLWTFLPLLLFFLIQFFLYYINRLLSLLFLPAIQRSLVRNLQYSFRCYRWGDIEANWRKFYILKGWTELNTRSHQGGHSQIVVIEVLEAIDNVWKVHVSLAVDKLNQNNQYHFRYVWRCCLYYYKSGNKKVDKRY